MKRAREQRGMIVAIGSRWHVRYWEQRNEGGQIVRKRVTHALAEITGRSTKHPPGDVIDAAQRHMATVNSCAIKPEQIIGLSQFATDIYLPWIKANKKPSTYAGYDDAWNLHLKALVARERSNLKDIRCYTVQRWLDAIAKQKLSRNSLKRIKSILSGMFKHAKRMGYYDGINPVVDTAVDPHAAEPAATYAYSLEEIQDILACLPEPADTVFAIAAFAGLRRGEIEALEWTDFHGNALHVSHSVWNGRLTAAKTRTSCASVPLIRQVSERLQMHKERAGNPSDGPIFRNEANHRLNLNNLLNRVILPALNRCGHCGESEGRAHLKQDHQYERDETRPAWRGFHAARRGLGSNLYRLGVSDKTIQQILRHSNVAVTLGYYVKTTNPDVVAGLQKLEERLTAETAGKSGVQNVQDTFRTVKPQSGALPESVN